MRVESRVQTHSHERVRANIQRRLKNAAAYLLPELNLHLNLVGHRFPGLPAVFFPVILLEPLLVL